MDITFLSYLIPIAMLLILSLFFLFFNGSHTSASSNYPPGSSGWPMVGENIEFFLSGAENFVKKRMNKFPTNVFQTSLMGEKMAIFCGPQGNKFLFNNEKRVLTSWWPQSIRKTLFFPEYVRDPSKDISSLTRRFLVEVLRPDALKQFIPLMDSLARAHLKEHWAPHDEVKVFPLSKVFTFTLGCKIFMGLDDPQHVKRLMELFNIVTKGMVSVPIDFPGTTYNRAIKGGALVREEIMKMINARNKELTERSKEIVAEGKDLMSQMLLFNNEDGQFFSEMEVTTFIIGLIIASYHTMSNAITFALKHLAEFPNIYEEVLREQKEIAKAKGQGELLNWEDIQKMTYTWNVIRESIRVTPPLIGGFQQALSDFTFEGFTIPKGWMTFWSVYSTHKNPKYFPDPEKFDPSRFEGSGPQPYTYAPFGGGPRMCPGKEYARIVMLVLLHNIVMTYKLEKCIPNEKIVYRSSPEMVKGLPVRLHRHKTE